MRYNFLLTSQYNRWLPINITSRSNATSNINFMFFLNKQKNNLLLYFLLDFSLSSYNRLKFYPYVKNGQFFFANSYIMFFDIMSLSWFIYICKFFFYIFSLFLFLFFFKNFFFWSYFYFFLFLTAEFYVHTFLTVFSNFFVFLFFCFFFFLWYPIFFFFNTAALLTTYLKFIFPCLLMLVCCYLLKTIQCFYTTKTTPLLNLTGGYVNALKNNNVRLPLIALFFLFFALITYYVFFLFLYYIVLNFFFFKNEKILYQLTKFHQKINSKETFYKGTLTFKAYLRNVNLALKRNLGFLFFNIFNSNSTNFRRNINVTKNKILLCNTIDFNKFNSISSNLFSNNLLQALYAITSSLSNTTPTPSTWLLQKHNSLLHNEMMSAPGKQTTLLNFNSDLLLLLSTNTFYHFNLFTNLKFINSGIQSCNNNQLNVRNNLFSLSSFFSANTYTINFLKTINTDFNKTNFFNFYGTSLNINNVHFNNVLIKNFENINNFFPALVRKGGYIPRTDHSPIEDKKFFFFINTYSLFYGYQRGLCEKFFLSNINFTQQKLLNRDFIKLYV